MLDMWLMESTRSRPGWAPVSAPSQGGSESNFGSFGSFKGTLRDDDTMRRRIGEILCHSDSQFYVPAPVLTPIFSNKVRTFADEDEERFSMIVNALEQKFHTLNHHTSSSCDSGSPSVSKLLIGGTAFPSTPAHSSNSGSAFPLNPVLKKVLSHGKTFPATPALKKPLSISSGSGFPENPVLKKVLSSSSAGNQSIGGGAFPQTPTHDVSSAGWKVAASLERTRKLASKIQNSPELLENMARELEELSLKYIKYEQMMRLQV